MPIRMKWLLLVPLISVSGCRCGDGGILDGGGLEDGGALEDGGQSDGGQADAGVIDAGDLFEACEIPPQAGGIPPECAVVNTGACATGADCPQGLCLALASGKVCTQPCQVDADCVNGRMCDRRSTGAGVEGFCVPAMRGGP